jgi:hypothetical protein
VVDFNLVTKHCGICLPLAQIVFVKQICLFEIKNYFTFIIETTPFLYFQELRSLEAELYDRQREQRQTEERLKQRDKELAAREIDLLERELNIMILQQVKPHP